MQGRDSARPAALRAWSRTLRQRVLAAALRRDDSAVAQDTYVAAFAVLLRNASPAWAPSPINYHSHEARAELSAAASVPDFWAA